LEAKEERMIYHRCQGDLWVDFQKTRTTKFQNLHSFALFIASHKFKLTASAQLIYILRIDFIAMAMPLPDLLVTAIQLTGDGPVFGARQEDSRSQAKAHSAAHVRFGDFRHVNDDRMLCSLLEFG